MPIPPPPPIAMTAVAAAVKVAVKEYLPTLTSASLAAWLLKWMWQRVPNWIKEDIVWGSNQKDGNEQQEERLSTLWERHRALFQLAESLLPSPVPHLPAALLAYVHVSSQLREQHTTCARLRNEMYEASGPLLASPQHTDRLCRALDWAVWAYELRNETSLRKRLAEDGFSLERCVKADRPGSVGYYVALSDTILLIAVKGTSSLEDIMTDTCGRPVVYGHVQGNSAFAEASIEVRGRIDDEVLVPPMEPWIFENCDGPGEIHSNLSIEVVSGHERVLFSGGETTNVLHESAHDDHQIRCHEGILLSATAIAREVQIFVQKYVVREEGGDCTSKRRLRLVGHSLGASVACFVAMILRSRYSCLATIQYSKDVDDHVQDGAPLHVYAFAPPPVVDHDSALACASFVTSVVNNADAIPRASMVNLALWLEVLRSVSNRLVEENIAPTNPKKLARFVRHVYGDGDSVADPLLTVEQIWKCLETGRENFPLRHPDHLYIPGEVLLFYQNWDSEDSFIEESSNQDAVAPNSSSYCCRVTDGAALVLQTFEIDGFRWLGDHTTASYYQCLGRTPTKTLQ